MKILITGSSAHRLGGLHLLCRGGPPDLRRRQQPAGGLLRKQGDTRWNQMRLQQDINLVNTK